MNYDVLSKLRCGVYLINAPDDKGGATQCWQLDQKN